MWWNLVPTSIQRWWQSTGVLGATGMEHEGPCIAIPGTAGATHDLHHSVVTLSPVAKPKVGQKNLLVLATKSFQGKALAEKQERLCSEFSFCFTLEIKSVPE